MKVATKDYHPADHISFASNHTDAKPFETFIDVKNHVGGKPEEAMKQRLWPVHCVQGTSGSDIIDEINMTKVDLVIQKGMDARVEMYSAFSDSFGNLTAGQGGVSHDLESIFTEKGITHVYVVGLAGDYCVKVSLHLLRKCVEFRALVFGHYSPIPSVLKPACVVCYLLAGQHQVPP